MRVNLEWLREWVEFEADADALADELTTIGLEVEAVLPAGPRLDGVVIARVTAVEPHPNADRLSLCIVEAGSDQYRVVCGAPNVAVDLRVPYAPVGARLPGGQAVTAAEIRGVASEGMLCSAKELGISDDASGLLVLDDSARSGGPLAEHLGLSDAVLDIALTPNRGDCFSVLGIAREIAAKRGSGLTGPGLESVPAQSEARFDVALANQAACPRFAGRVVRNLDANARTPDWIKERLRRAGSRPLHPVVDVTNYVMLELGQPLHAYDLNKLAGHIVVRSAKPGEPLTLLDGKQIELADNTLVIGDDSGAIGMAGIMGGASTAVQPGSRDVFLEAAFFAPDAILGRARQYGLHTDAALRFERGVDPTQQERAIERATRLLLEIAGGEPGPIVLAEANEALPSRSGVRLRLRKLEALLGVEIARADAERHLQNLGMQVSFENDAWVVIPPMFRFDIEIEEDLIEEVGRLVGYDKIPKRAGTGTAELGHASESLVDEERIADVLVARGYSEVITYSFVDKELAATVNPGSEVLELVNPISSDLAVMRRSLWPGLLLTAQQNLSRQQSRLRIFEIGHQFVVDADCINEINVLSGLAVGPSWPEQWALEQRDVDYYDVKADIEALLVLGGRHSELRFEPAEHPALKPGQTARVWLGTEPIGWLGSIHPQVQRKFDLKSPAILFVLRIDATFAARLPSYHSYSKFPFVRRDLALVVDEAVSADRLLEHVRAAGGTTLQSVTVFDVYRGQGIESSRKSLALGLILQDASRTLTDRDADRTVQSVTQRLEKELGATIRT